MSNIRCSIFGLLLCLLLPSCIDGREEVWIDAKGGGRAEFTYDLPAVAASLQGGVPGVEKLLRTLLENQPGATHEVTQIGDRLKIQARIPFSSLGDLSRLASPPKKGERPLPAAFKHFAGTFDLRRSGRTIDISRTIEPGKAIPGGRFIPPSQLETRRLVHIIHLPIPATASNATRTEDSGRTLIWEHPLASALRKPVTTRFQAVVPLPAWLVPSDIGLSLAATIGITLLIRSIRKSRQANKAR